ncbi:shikimate dehydrogenase [Bacillus spongiae]|uniref:Shikimate dehydrogenase (NADP(+)) n=1 Tax=Bacillus spongiae TaxID=2683610 RepID=A0ABU8H9E8_9BACI
MNRLFGVIGDPIAHSMSPLMHNAIISAHHLKGYYHPFHIKRKDLEVAIKGMKALGVEGFNVTIPHKESILPLLDKVDPLAKAIGAVNTVVREGDSLIGYNTDGDGFISSLEKTVCNEDSVLVVGAGGAAKAIVYSLANKGIAHIDITNRTVEKAEEMLQKCPFPLKGKALSLEIAEKHLNRYDVIIQTTSIGMHPYIEESPMEVRQLKKSAFIVDIIYNPSETKFLQEARKQGAQVQNGLGMFVHQGALAFEKWTGIQPNTMKMKQVVLNQLGGNDNANR